jgi:signal transduction histidine kinase
VKLRRVRFLFILLVCVLLVGIAVVWKARSAVGDVPTTHALPFWFEEIVEARITRNLPFFVADIDLDGNDDLLINEPTRLLWYRLHGREMSLTREVSYGISLGTRMVTDATGDGHPDFFVLTESSKGPLLSCHDWYSAKGPAAALYTVGPLFQPAWNEADPWKRLVFFGSFSTKHGDHPMILVGVNSSSRAGTPRSLLACDGVTGKELWRYRFAPLINELAYDNSETSAPILLFTTQSANTKISFGGMVDTESYLICLDALDGNLLWRKRVTGEGGRSSLTLADINGDGQKEILVARFLTKSDSIFRDDPFPWTVEVLNRQGAALDSVPLAVRSMSICAANLDSMPFPEILVQDLKGDLIFLDSDLTLRRVIAAPRRSVPRRSLMIGVRDLTGDGRPEIIYRMDNQLMVRDSEGTLVAERILPQYFQAQLARYDGMDRIVIEYGGSIHILTLKPTTAMTWLLVHSLPLSVAALAAAVVFGVGGFHLRRYHRRRREGPMILDGVHSDLLRTMSAFGHGGSSLRVIDRIRLHLKNWDRVQADAAARGELFARLHATFVETVMPELEHIVMLAHRAQVPEDIWSMMLVRAGIADKEMQAILAAGSGELVSRSENHIAAALQALEDVDSLLAKVRSYLRSVFRTSIAEALEHVAARFRETQGTREISLTLPSDLPAVESVFVKPIVFEKILEILLSNSARATEARADAAIAIEVHWEGNYCKIDIRDNGCGIPRDDWERVFERSYTTKVEGGFGLYYAHEELARFNGRVFVLDSVVGAGTTMRVVLRKS